MSYLKSIHAAFEINAREARIATDDPMPMCAHCVRKLDDEIAKLTAEVEALRKDCTAMAGNWAHLPGTGAIGAMLNINCWHCDAEDQPVLMENFKHAPDCLAMRYAPKEKPECLK